MLTFMCQALCWGNSGKQKRGGLSHYPHEARSLVCVRVSGSQIKTIHISLQTMRHAMKVKAVRAPDRGEEKILIHNVRKMCA